MSWKEINQKIQEIKTFQFKENTIPDEGEDSKGRYYKRIDIGAGKDITNNTYGHLTAVFPVKDKNEKRKWLFKCKCGNTSLSVMGDVVFGKAQSCGCVSKNGFINLKGQHLGRLTVLEYTGKDSKWKCKCDCGNIIIMNSESLRRDGNHSCGCYKSKITIDRNRSLTKRYVGEKFGFLEIVEDMGTIPEKGDNFTYYKCYCSKCEKYVLRNWKFFNYKGIQSCGCWYPEKHCYDDLTGKKYGFLEVIELAYITEDKKSVYWKCRCECGNYTNVWSANLKGQKIISCGCAKISIGEKNILETLKKNNIYFEREYRFGDCLNKKKLPFDFAIFSKKGGIERLIEYDGKQHYEANDYFGGEEQLKQTQLRDKIKNEYCFSHSIPLVRIPYTVKDITLETIMGDEYLVRPEKEGEYNV